MQRRRFEKVTLKPRVCLSDRHKCRMTASWLVGIVGNLALLLTNEETFAVVEHCLQ